MNDYAVMGSAIYGRLGTVQYTYQTSGTVTTTGTVPTRDTQVKQGTNPPYVIYQLQDSLDMYVFGTKSGESADYLIKVVSDREFPTMQAFAIADQIHAAMQDAPLSIAGGYLLRCRRTSRVQYQDSQFYWHVGGIYRIDRWTT